MKSWFWVVLCACAATAGAQDSTVSIADKTAGMEHLDGYFGLNWNFEPKRLANLVRLTVAAGMMTDIARGRT